MADSEKYVWTRESSKLLASLLENEQAIWNRLHPEYKSSVARHDALSRLSTAMDIPLTFIASKIKSITGQYQREMRNVSNNKSGSGGDARYKPSWFLFEHLKFLGPTSEVRSTISSTNLHRDVEVEEITEFHNSEASVHDDFIEQEERQELMTGGTEVARTSVVPKVSDVYKKRKCDDADMARAVVTLANSLAEPVPKMNTSAVNKDEWDLFGELIAKKIRNIVSRAIRMQTEFEINNILLKKCAEDAGLAIIDVSASSYFIENEVPQSEN